MKDFSFIWRASEAEVGFLLEHTHPGLDSFAELEKVVEKKYPKLRPDLERIRKRDPLNEV